MGDLDQRLAGLRGDSVASVAPSTRGETTPAGEPNGAREPDETAPIPAQRLDAMRASRHSGLR